MTKEGDVCRLAVWEAQFGDFFNGAQMMIDTFVASAESEWGTRSDGGKEGHAETYLQHAQLSRQVADAIGSRDASAARIRRCRPRTWRGSCSCVTQGSTRCGMGGKEKEDQTPGMQTPVDGENVNIRVANPTTAAQYFHLLRTGGQGERGEQRRKRKHPTGGHRAS